MFYLQRTESQSTNFLIYVTKLTDRNFEHYFEYKNESTFWDLATFSNHLFTHIFSFSPNPVLVLVFVVYNRRREAQIKYPNPDDDVRENIINYEDEVRYFWNLEMVFCFQNCSDPMSEKIVLVIEKNWIIIAKCMRLLKQFIHQG